MLNKILILIILLTSSVFAAETYTLEADEVFGKDNDSFIAQGNVKIIFKNSVITAEQATYYPKSRTIEATGNVKIVDGTQNINADRILYSLEQETGEVENIKGVLEGQYHVCARKMEKTGKEIFLFEGVIVTTCEGDTPDWSFEFNKAEAEINGYLFGEHATANIKNMPLMYLPALIYPLKTKRQTGFLIPSAGYDTNLGVVFTEDFFWAIDTDKDATLGANLFTDRGWQGVSEFRYELGADSKIYLSADIIDDGWEKANYDERWSLTSKSLIRPFDNVELIADVRLASDNMYMRDFSEYLLYDVANFENKFLQYYSARYYTPLGTLSATYFNDIKYNDINTGYRSNVVTQSPLLEFQNYGYDLNFLTLDWYLSWSDVHTNTYQYDFLGKYKSIEKHTYNRSNNRFTIFQNYNSGAITLKPYAQINYTLWNNWDNNSITQKNSHFAQIRKMGNSYDRLLPEIGFKANHKELYSYYGNIKHSIFNTLEYTYIKDIDQEGLPNHLENDRIPGQNSLTVTTNNYLKDTNWQIALNLKQAFDFETSMPLKPLESTLQFTTQNFSNNTKLNLDYYKQLSDDNILIFENDTRIGYDVFNINLKYLYDSVQLSQYNTTFETFASVELEDFILYGGIIWKSFNNYISFSDFEPVEGKTGIVLKSQCWNMGIGFTTEKYAVSTSAGRELERNYKIELAIELKGLGENKSNVYKNIKKYD